MLTGFIQVVFNTVIRGSLLKSRLSEKRTLSQNSIKNDTLGHIFWIFLENIYYTYKNSFLSASIISVLFWGLLYCSMHNIHSVCLHWNELYKEWKDSCNYAVLGAEFQSILTKIEVFLYRWTNVISILIFHLMSQVFETEIDNVAHHTMNVLRRWEFLIINPLLQIRKNR